MFVLYRLKPKFLPVVTVIHHFIEIILQYLPSTLRNSLLLLPITLELSSVTCTLEIEKKKSTVSMCGLAAGKMLFPGKKVSKTSFSNLS